jgi:DnaK suppressor protein
MAKKSVKTKKGTKSKVKRKTVAKKAVPKKNINAKKTTTKGKSKVTKKKTANKTTKPAAKSKSVKKKPLVKKKTTAKKVSKSVAQKKTAKKKPVVKKKTSAKKTTTKGRSVKTTTSKVKASKKTTDTIIPVKKAKVSKSARKLAVSKKEPKSPSETRAEAIKKISGYSKKDLQHFRELILEKREEILEDLQSLKEQMLDPTTGEYINENSPYSLHMAEQGTDAMEREKTFLYAQRENKFLGYLDDALKRIETGIYGICIECIDVRHNLCETCPLIPKARLEAVPHTQHCLPIKQRKGGR